MTDQKTLALRAKIIGVLLRDARLAAGKTTSECGQVLSLSAAAYASYEFGQKSPSLPELELLSFFFNVPLSHFWGEDIISEAPDRAAGLNTAELLTLRNRIIGLQLRQARLANKKPAKELAALIGQTTARLKAYELGEHPVPLPELETLAGALGLNVEDFFERQGRVGEWDASRRAYEKFKDLPPDVQDFVMNPLNESYLRVAMRLADMPADTLKNIAASLLDITY